MSRSIEGDFDIYAGLGWQFLAHLARLHFFKEEDFYLDPSTNEWANLEQPYWDRDEKKFYLGPPKPKKLPCKILVKCTDLNYTKLTTILGITKTYGGRQNVLDKKRYGIAPYGGTP